MSPAAGREMCGGADARAIRGGAAQLGGGKSAPPRAPVAPPPPSRAPAQSVCSPPVPAAAQQNGQTACESVVSKSKPYGPSHINIVITANGLGAGGRGFSG